MMDTETIVNAALAGAVVTGVFFAGRELCRRAGVVFRQSRVPSRPGKSPFDTPEFRAADAADAAELSRVKTTIDTAIRAEGPV